MESAAAASLNTSFTRHLITLLNENISRGISVAEMNAIMVRDAVIIQLEHSPWHKLAKDLTSLSFLLPVIWKYALLSLIITQRTSFSLWVWRTAC